MALGLVLSAHAGTPTNFYNFLGGEIYPVDDSIGRLRAADLAGDGRKELVFLETAKHYLGIFRFDSRHKLARLIR